MGLWKIFHLSIFVLSCERYYHQSHWICKFRSFFPYFSFLPSRKVWTSLSVGDTDFKCFSSHNPRKLWQTTMDWTKWWRIYFSFLILTWKASRASAADWRYQTHIVKKISRIFSVSRNSFSQGYKSLCNTVVYMIKNIDFLHIWTFLLVYLKKILLFSRFYGILKLYLSDHCISLICNSITLHNVACVMLLGEKDSQPTFTGVRSSETIIYYYY